MVRETVAKAAAKKAPATQNPAIFDRFHACPQRLDREWRLKWLPQALLFFTPVPLPILGLWPA